MQKKLISALLVLCLALSLLPFGALAAGFEDLTPGEYYIDAVNWAVEKGIARGTTGTTFSPSKTCTRAEVVTFLWRAFGSPKMYITNPFQDVPTTEYFYNPAVWASDKGITNGTDATHFSPNEPCTRAQVATFLWRTLNKPGVAASASPFADVQDAQAYFFKPVLWAVESGVTNGTDETHFSPNDPCTRAQIVTFLFRALEESETTTLLLRKMTTDGAGNMQGYVYSYDAHGNNTRVANLDGSAWELYTHDENGRTTAIERSSGESLTRTYDAQGRKLTDTYADHTMTLTYDAKGNVTAADFRYTDASKNRQLRMTYDEAGNLLTAEDTASGQLIVNTYDAKNRHVKQETYANASKETLLARETRVYDNADGLVNLRTERWENGVETWMDASYTLDEQGYPLRAHETHSDGTVVNETYKHTFKDNVLLVKTEVQRVTMHADGTSETVNETTEYTYTSIKTSQLPSAWENRHAASF